MFNVFIPEDTLSSICEEEMGKSHEDYSNWYKIFTKQHEIMISATHECNEWNEDDPLFIFSESYDVNILYDTEYITSVIESPINVLKEPGGIFILDVDDVEAHEIQNDYGVICQSTKNMDAANLIGECISFSPRNGDTEYSWKRVLKDVNHLPSNSLLMIDRNLFANTTERNQEAFSNIRSILDELLPTTFKDCYHVCIITDPDAIKRTLKFLQISKKIADSINGIRKYPITIEVIAISRHCDSEYYEWTHDRRILVNYCIIEATHKLNAFRDGVSICSQTINTKRLFSVNSLNGMGDVPMQSLDNDMCTFKNFVETWKQKEHDAWKNTEYANFVNYSCDDKAGFEAKDLKNRLFH